MEVKVGGATVTSTSVPGNPAAIILGTEGPLVSATVKKLYVRTKTDEGFSVQIIEGTENIKNFLLQQQKK